MLSKASLVLFLLTIASTGALANPGDFGHGQEPLDLYDDLEKYRLNADVHTATAQEPVNSDAWLKKYGAQIDQPFSGPLSFSHLPYARCLENTSAVFDIAVLGMPFDTAVTYRPGARFGPYAIRSGSRRQRESRGYTLAWRNNPYELGSRIIDCGDVSADGSADFSMRDRELTVIHKYCAASTSRANRYQ